MEKVEEYPLEYKGIKLTVHLKNGETPIITFDDFSEKQIREMQDGSWMYHEESKNAGEYFNVHLKPDGSFAYSNEDTPPKFNSRFELFETHQFIREIVEMMEHIKKTVQERKTKESPAVGEVDDDGAR